jgi:competence protein ComEC
MVGLVLAGFLSSGPAIPLAAGGVILFLFGWGRLGQTWGVREIMILLSVAMAFAGYIRAERVADLHERKLALVAPLSPPVPTHIRGILSSQFTKRSTNRWAAVLEMPDLWDGRHWVRLPGVAEIHATTTGHPSGLAGQWLSASGKWKKVGAPGAPGDIDPRQWSELTGVVGWLAAGAGGIRSEEHGSLSLSQRLVRARDAWRSKVREWMLSSLPPSAGALALAITTGDRGDLPEGIQQDLLKSGLLHLTAVSGLNVTIVLLALPLSLKAFGVKRRWRALMGIPLALFLFALVGGQASVMRATLVGVALMLAVFLERPADAINLLAGAALALLMVSPIQLRQPGFLLSFLTVAALLLWGPSTGGGLPSKYTFERFLQHWLRPTGLIFRGSLSLGYWLLAAIWTSAVATLAVAPVSAWFFHTVTWTGVFSNLVAVPLAEGVTLLGVLAAFGLAFVPWLGSLVAWPLGVLSSVLARWISWAAGLPFGFEHTLSPDPLVLGLILGALLVLALPREWFVRRVWNRRTIPLVLLALLSWWPLIPARGCFRLDFLDVGQGDATLLRFPNGETMLIDTGPPSTQGNGTASRLVNSLLALGVRRIDALVLSHPDLDHAGALTELLDGLSIRKILVSGDTNETDAFRHLAEVLAATQVPMERVLAGDKLQGIAGASLTALGPSREAVLCRIGERNDRSVVLLIEQQGFSALWLGDISSDVERDLVEDYPDLHCDILKVAHHGSRYASCNEFLAHVRPEVAVIECGINNFGHPSPETVERLESAGATVFTTLSNGTVELAWDGRRLLASTAK